MKGNEQVIEALNAGLTIELTAINTYFIHSKMLRNWGLNKLADYYYAESIEEMKHADEVIDRILHKDLEQRYQDGKEVAEDLRNLMQALG